MKFAWIGFEREVNQEIIVNFIKDKFNITNCYEYELEYLSDLLNSLNINNVDENPSIVFYKITRNESEFPIVWEFISLPDMQGVIRSEVYLAYYLSKKLDCKTITNGSGFGLDNSEYWDIVFGNDKVFLVDDLETKFFGDGDSLLRFVMELDLHQIIRLKELQ